MSDLSKGATWRVLEGECRDVLRALDTASAQTCITSPPYFGLRDYGHDGQIGHEPTLDDYVSALVEVFREVRRVLRDDGTLWVNLGDSWGPGKQLLGIPWRVAFALQADGWVLRSDIVWSKPNAMPEGGGVRDRPGKAHEYLFLLAKSPSYYYDQAAICEVAEGRVPEARASIDNSRHSSIHLSGRGGFGGETRNKRSVWTVSTQPYAGAHFATFPPKLIEPCILAGSREGDTVLDPFAGAGTTGFVALRHGRSFVGIEIKSEYAEMARTRIRDDAPLLNSSAEVAA